MTISKLTRIILLISLLSATLPIYAGGPWLQKAKGGYSQFSYTFLPAYSSLFTTAKNLDNISLNREVSDITITAYGEYGLSNRLTLIGSIPFKMTETGEADLTSNFYEQNLLSAGNLSGVGNVSLALKTNIISKKYLLSAQTAVAFNSASSDSLTGLRTGISAFTVTPSLIFGRGFANMFAYLEGGIQIRTADYSNNLVIQGEVGRQFAKRFWVIAVLDILENLNTGVANNQNAEQTGLYVDNQAYFAFGFKFIAEFTPNFGLNLSGFGASSGNFVAASPANTIGLYYRW